MSYDPNLREEKSTSEEVKENNPMKIKAFLLDKLKNEKAFWSYEQSYFTIDSIPDELLIALTLRHLDLEEIDLLYDIYSPRRIKEAWINQLVPEGDYLRALNRFIAWFYFKIKNPDRYLKILEAKHLNKLLQV